MSGHVPVMLSEVLEAIGPRDGEIYLDGTFGGGGYARAILGAADCRLIGLDRDETAYARACQYQEEESRLIPVLGRFGDMHALAGEAGFEAFDAVVLDLGVSSFQLCLLYTSPSPRDQRGARMPSSA